jgi:hypothetical protein
MIAFWSNVSQQKATACWPWTASCAHGYGQLWAGVPRRKWQAHRLAWTLKFGRIPPGFCVLHRCDNRGCCNPRHLWLGTRGDNNRDRHLKGRDKAGVGERNARSRIVAADVVEIRRLRQSGMTFMAIGRRFGMTDEGVRGICLRRTWRHV